MSANESIMVIKTQLTWQSGERGENWNSSNTSNVSPNALENKRLHDAAECRRPICASNGANE